MTWFFNNWKPIAAVLAIIVVYGYGYRNGGNALQEEFNKALAAQNAKNLIVNERVSNELSKKNADLRNTYAELKRLRSSRGVSVSKSAASDNGATSTDGLHGNLAENVDSLMYEADVNTSRLLSCQKWIKEQSN